MVSVLKFFKCINFIGIIVAVTTFYILFAIPEYSQDGCKTLWTPGQGYITCSCDHLTYFGVLMVGLIFLTVRTDRSDVTKYPVCQQFVIAEEFYKHPECDM